MKGIYFGWYMVALAIITNAILVGTMFASFGLFVAPVSATFHLSRADINSAMIFLNIGTALTAPVVGRLLDRLSLKRTLVFSAIAVGASLAVVSQTNLLWLDVVILLLPLPFLLQTAGLLAMPALLVRWFKANLGRAMALAMVGMSLGGILVPPLIAMLLDNYGWRQTLLICAGGHVSVLVPLFLLVRDRPGPADIEPKRAARAVAGPDTAPAPHPAGFRSILSSGEFWMISLSAGLALAVFQSTQISLIPIGKATGLSNVHAASLTSALFAGVLSGMLLVAYLGDRIEKVALLVSMYALLGVMIAGLLSSRSFAGLLVASAGLGVASATPPIYQALVANRFGPQSFGTVRGLMVPISVVPMAAFMRLAGEVFDRTGRYDPMLYAFIAVQLFASFMIYSTRWCRRFDLSATNA